MYAYDATNKCFLKNIAKHRHKPALVFYAVNNHMYWISNKDVAYSLIQKAKNPEHKINSTMFADKTKKEERDKQARLFSQLDIKENIDIKDLMDYDNCIIIYNQSSSSIELEIIEQYKYIPNVKCKHGSTFII